MNRALIIDLDDTLADTSLLAPLREARQWKNCVRSLHRAIPFEELSEALEGLQARGIAIGVVTASVSFYAAALLRHLNINHDTLIAYHDCSPRKPHPAPIQMALQRLNVEPAAAIGVGDAMVDCEAYQAAGIGAWGAGWSSHLDVSAPWDQVLNSPQDLVARFSS